MEINRFQDQVALITGAASGIGKATALRLGEEGAKLMICDLNETGLREVSSRLTEKGVDNDCCVFDVSDPKACRASVEKTIRRFGKLNVLCNIAGYSQLKHLAEIRVEDWHKMIDVNLSSVFYMSQAAMPHLITTHGNIVNMSSTAALSGQAYNSMYCATKGGVAMLSKSMAVEFSKQGVRVNALCPGAVATPLSQNFTIPENVDMDLIGKLFPLLVDIAQPEEVAAAVAFISSAEARFVTGETFVMDGGQTIT
jgi:meso-butanediol dehydrogenase/(S,S)-butanediol dehydrogenase/diacetyl reductase